MPDTLTPGLDRCTWAVTDSSISRNLQITAYRTADYARVASARGTRVAGAPSLGAEATLDKGQHALTWKVGGDVLGLEIITAHGAKLNEDMANRDLVELAELASGSLR